LTILETISKTIPGCNSTKIQHSYKGFNFFDTYSQYFSKVRDGNLKLLEIGVDTGASLRLWKNYLPNSNIYGLDIDHACKKYEEDRIKIFIGGQTDNSILNEVIKEGPYDAIIDDGSHVNKFTIETFNKLFPHVTSKGLYVIEDLHCCYELLEDLNVRKIWPGMSYSPSVNLNNNPQDFKDWIWRIFDDQNNPHNQKGDILSLQLWPKICFIIKV